METNPYLYFLDFKVAVSLKTAILMAAQVKSLEDI